MKKFFLISFFATLLIAQNPKIYSTLGNIIYDNADKIVKLQEIPSFNQYLKTLQQYFLDVNKTKQLGNTILPNDTNNKMEYLKQLRKLSVINDFFIRSVQKSFELAMKNEDNKLFFQLVNSGLLDIKTHKKKIIDYYVTHSQEIDKRGVIQELLDKDAKLLQQKKSQVEKELNKKKIQEAKIKRIREKDLQEHENLKKFLEEDISRKKVEIIQEQKKELENGQ